MGRMRLRRAAVLGSVYVLFLGHLAHGLVSGHTLAPLEFSASLQTVHRGVLTAGALFFALSLVATLVFGRFFCGWGCHFLAIQDLASAALRRVGIHGTAPRWRVLGFGPPLLVAYLYVWPWVLRAVGAGEPPGPAPEAGSGLFTSDVWQGMPGPGITILSFLVGAVAMVAVLGPRAFCFTVCPYGVFFAGADRLATRRVVLTGGCSGCNRCSAACQSGVDVLAELRAHGAVRDPGCFRDLDCVAVCPTGAITFAPAPRILLPERPVRGGAPLREELAVGAITLAAFLAYRGLHDLIPVLLAFPMAVLTAVILVRTTTRVRERLGDGRGLDRDAAAGILGATLVFGLLVHSGGIRALEVRATAASIAAQTGDPAAVAEALAAWEAVRDNGVYVPVSVRSRLADLYLRTGDYPAAVAELTRIVATTPEDDGAARVLERLRASGVDSARPPAAF